MSIFLFVCLVALAFALSAFLTVFVRQKLLARAVMDIPNERSMHKVPVPRGGGLAFMIVTVGGLALAALCPEVTATPVLLLVAGSGLLMLISWLDDKHGAGVRIRLAIHLLVALIGSFALGEQATVLGGMIPFWLDRLLVVLGWGWFMNLYNFMDGIDGLTGAQSIGCAAAAALAFFLSDQSDPATFILAALIIGSCAGFLTLNWHPAKIFAGDVGSVPLGFLIGFLLLKLAAAGHPAPALLIPLYYLADSGFTITKRFLRGEKIWQAHRQHAYQRATVGEKSPVPVVLWIIAGNTGLAFAATLAMDTPWLGLAVGVGILGLLMAKLKHSARKTA